MQPSVELENLIRQLYEKEASGGLADYASKLFSAQEGTLVIGTDPNEYFKDYDSIIRFYEANALELEIKVLDLNAYSEGTVGWGMDRVEVKLPNGSAIPIRHTYIFHKENDAWKMVHTHISVAVPNESLGV